MGRTIIRQLTPLILAGFFLLGVAGCGGDDKPTGGNNPPDESEFEVSVTDFSPSSECQSCHPQHYKEWSGSMHAYSLRDPVWHAVREVGQSAYANALAGSCSPCHGTVGNRSGVIRWGPFDPDDLAPQVSDGVGCDICHVITSLHGLSNAAFDITPGSTKYGSIVDPIATSAHESQFSTLYRESEYCGSCHDFILSNGTELEAVFREWQSGGFAVTGKTCNGCHMPTYEGQATPDGPTRTLHRHAMPGADIALIDFPNKDEQFQLVEEMLKDALTLDAEASFSESQPNELHIDVSITNDKTGHNVPSGVPFNREVWLRVIVRNGAGTKIYSSGELDVNDDLMDKSSDADLFIARAQMLKSDSTPTGATWEAAYIDNPSIKPGETRVVPYNATVAEGDVGPFTVEVTLRFRSFSPSLIRSLNLMELLPIPIVDMASVTRTVANQS